MISSPTATARHARGRAGAGWRRRQNPVQPEGQAGAGQGSGNDMVEMDADQSRPRAPRCWPGAGRRGRWRHPERCAAGCPPVPVPTASIGSAPTGNQMGGTGGTPSRSMETPVISIYEPAVRRGDFPPVPVASSVHRPILAGRNVFRAGKSNARSFPSRLPDLSEEPAGAECASQARHVTRQAGQARRSRLAAPSPRCEISAAAEARDGALRE